MNAAAVPVVDRYARAWPEHPDDRANGFAKYMPVDVALTTTHDTDAHFAAYSLPAINRRLASSKIFEQTSVPIALFIVDVDAESAVTAAWWQVEKSKLARMLAEHPGAFVYRTGGGYRIAYQLAAPVVLASADDAGAWKWSYVAWLEYLADHFDIRGDHACKDWTRLYRLPFVVRDGEPQTLETIGDAHALGTWSVPVPPRPPPAPKPERKEPTRDHADKRLRRAAAYLAKMDPAVEEQGGSTALWNAVAAVLIGFDLSEPDAEALITSDYNPRCSPPWSEKEIRHKIEHVAERCDRERGYLLGVTEDAARDPSTHDRNGAPVEPKADKSDPWQVALAAALADIRTALGTTATASRTPLFGDAVELLGAEFASSTWLVDGLLTRGGVSLVGGEPKTFKTWLGLEACVAVATSTRMCGEFFAAAGVAAYFFAEDMGRQVRNRLRALLAGANRSLFTGRLHLCPRGKFLDITKDEDLALLVASCRLLGKIDLLVLDPLRDVSSAAEDKSDEMSPVMRRLRVVAELLGCTVMVVHHTAKASLDTSKRRPGQRLRGSGAIHGATDSGIYLSDTQGDGRTEFKNTVDSEIKGAQSAGRFSLTLNIEDDDNKEAVRASWQFSRAAAGVGQDPGAADDDLMLRHVTKLAAAGDLQTATTIAESGAVMPDKRCRAAIDRLLATGALVKRLDKRLGLSDAATRSLNGVLGVGA